MADSFAGTLITKRHCVFTVTPDVAAPVPGKGQSWSHKRSAQQSELRSGGVLVSRASGPLKEELTLKWTFAAADVADVTGYVAPAIDEIVAITGAPITEQNGDYNVAEWNTDGQEGGDLTGTCKLVREGGTALAAL